MSSGIDQAEAKRLVEASTGVTAYTAPTTPVKAALTTTQGSDAAAGTEVANAGGSSYARQTLGAGTATMDASGAVNANTGVLSFTNMPATTTTGVEHRDSSTAPGRRGFWGDLAAAKTTALGDTLSFAVGALTARIG